MNIDITMLGSFAVAIDKAMVDPAHWRRRHAAALVKILALETRRTLHRERGRNGVLSPMTPPRSNKLLPAVPTSIPPGSAVAWLNFRTPPVTFVIPV